MDIHKILIRASSTGKLMTNGKAKNSMGETAKTYLRQLLKEEKYGRTKEISSKYLEKGRKGEEDAITLLSLEKGVYLKKNEIRLDNEYVTGEPDAILGNDINNCTEGYDVKCPFDIFTMPTKLDALNKDYYWQAQTYMWLTGATKWTIAYCLINSPFQIIIDDIKREWYKMGMPDEDDIEYLKKCRNIEALHIYDLPQYNQDNSYNKIDEKGWDKPEIPQDKRILEYVVEFNPDDIQRLKDRIVEGREYMKQLNDII